MSAAATPSLSSGCRASCAMPTGAARSADLASRRHLSSDGQGVAVPDRRRRGCRPVHLRPRLAPADRATARLGTANEPRRPPFADRRDPARLVPHRSGLVGSAGPAAAARCRRSGQHARRRRHLRVSRARPERRPSLRVEIWAYGRRSPFLSWSALVPWTTAALGRRSVTCHGSSAICSKSPVSEKIRGGRETAFRRSTRRLTVPPSATEPAFPAPIAGSHRSGDGLRSRSPPVIDPRSGRCRLRRDRRPTAPRSDAAGSCRGFRAGAWCRAGYRSIGPRSAIISSSPRDDLGGAAGRRPSARRGDGASATTACAPGLTMMCLTWTRSPACSDS